MSNYRIPKIEEFVEDFEYEKLFVMSYLVPVIVEKNTTLGTISAKEKWSLPRQFNCGHNFDTLETIERLLKANKIRVKIIKEENE